MNKKILAGFTLSLLSISFAQAMEMATGSMMKKDTMGVMMMKASSSVMDMATEGSMPMYSSIMTTSKKADITKLQMMLVTKGYLTMPKGASYGYYGSLTKMAYQKYTMEGMMKSGTDASMMRASSTMMNH